MFGKGQSSRDEGMNDYDLELDYGMDESQEPQATDDVVYEDDDYYEDEGYYEDDYYYEDQEEPQKTVKHTALYMLVVLLISAVLAVMVWFVADDVLALTKSDNVVPIVISEGDNLEDVAQNLKDHGLIRYKFLFKLYGKISHAEEKFSTGTFELNQQFDYHALVNGLAAASETRKTVTLTFPEGYTCDQIFAMLADNDVCTRADLEDTAANYDFEYEFLASRPYGARNRLEGFLFPDTYDFYVDDDAVRVINKFLSNFEGHLSDELLGAVSELNADIRQRMTEEGTFTQEEIDGAEMDIYKVLTVASLIEKEAGSDQERSLIASVIYNRLTTHVHELLQIDASVEYALGEHKEQLTANDLAVDNPYNTYKYKGLPPGPIANPGLSSIMAALYPEDTDFFFYALDGRSHRFFETHMQQQEFLRGEEPEEQDDTGDAAQEDPAAGEADPEGEAVPEDGETSPEGEENG